MLLVAILLRVQAANADPLATATFITNVYTDPITGVGQACVQLAYDNAPFTFGTTSVNFGDPANPFYADGLYCTVSSTPTTPGFTGHCTSSPDSTLYGFDFAGSQPPCSGSPCVISFVSQDLSNSSGSVYQSLAQLFPNATYTFDGTRIDTSTSLGPTIPGCNLPSDQIIATGTGQVGFNVFVPAPTNPGTDVTVNSTVTAFNPVTGTTVTTPVSVNFASVTGAGTTQVTATSNVAGNLSTNFSVSGNGYQAEFFDVSTTATITPPIVVCQQYQVDANGFVLGTTVPETSLRILHGEGTPPTFVDVTSSQDTSTHTICGTVSSLSPFVVAVGPTGPCTTVPQQNCTRTTVPLSAQFLISEPATSAATHKADTLVWKWLKGAPTTTSDFGNPLTTDSYALCAYDDDGVLTFTAGIPAGGTCQVGRSHVPCWKALGKPAGSTGFKYNDAAGTADGIKSVLLKPGALNTKSVGTAQIVVNGKGPNLFARPTGVPGLPTLPIAMPQRVQLQASSGKCWEAIHSQGTDTATQFTGKGN